MLTNPLNRVKALTLTTLAAAIYLTLRRRRITPTAAYAALQLALAKIYHTIESNQFLQAMVIPSALGLVYYWFQTYILNELSSRLRNWFYCSITISSKDENFKPVVDYIAKLTLEKNTLLLAETKKKKFDRKSWRREWNGISERKPPELDYRPAKSGAMMTFEFQSSELYLWRKRGQTVTTGYDRTPLELEELTIATWAGNIDVLKSFMKSALRDTFEEAGDETNIYVLSDSWAGGWENAMTKKPRPQGSIVLDGNISEQLIADANQFLSSAQWYVNILSLLNPLCPPICVMYNSCDVTHFFFLLQSAHKHVCIVILLTLFFFRLFPGTPSVEFPTVAVICCTDLRVAAKLHLLKSWPVP